MKNLALLLLVLSLGVFAVGCGGPADAPVDESGTGPVDVDMGGGEEPMMEEPAAEEPAAEEPAAEEPAAEEPAAEEPAAEEPAAEEPAAP